MEREAKRKAQSQPQIEYETPRSSKRQKLPTEAESTGETPETTTEAGLKFLTSLKNTKDKTGRLIATAFLHLPDKNTPGYYEVTKMPIALDMIEKKLNNQEYANLSALESDMKRLVANGKSFNERGSSLYEDVERVRKQASNWMTKHNPAYRDKNYVAVATPIPGEQTGATATPSQPPRELTERPSRSGRTSASAAPEVKQKLAEDEEEEPAVDEEQQSVEHEESIFKGLSFQEAQVALIEYMIKYTEDELEIFEPFMYLPSRALLDYYRAIKHPVSLRGLEKRIHGRHGRAAATGVSDFKSWDALEDEAAFIWKNCRTYNEDGSEMYELAGEFETLFKEAIEEARVVVPQPQQQKLKLKLAQPKQSGIKIRLGGARDSPTETPAPTSPGDTGTPAVAAAENASGSTAPNTTGGANGIKPALTNGHATHSASHNSRSASATSPPAQTNGIKYESSATPSVAHAHVPVTAYRPPVPQHGPAGLNISLYRPPGQRPSDYLIPSVRITTHPSLALPNPLSIMIPASTKTVQQSVTINIPPTHYHLQIIPDLPVATTNLPYRFFVHVNGVKVSETIKAGVERDRQHPLFEARLERGAVHRIDVEVLAVKPAVGDVKEEVQWEKTSCLVHIPRD